jgi:CBS domain-containing protein
MRAIDVMTSRVVTATPEMTVQEVAKLMINNRISGLPIVDEDRQLVGIVTEGDLLRRAEKRDREAALALERVVLTEFLFGRGLHQVTRQTAGRHHDA